MGGGHGRLRDMAVCFGMHHLLPHFENPGIRPQSEVEEGLQGEEPLEEEGRGPTVEPSGEGQRQEGD